MEGKGKKNGRGTVERDRGKRRERISSHSTGGQSTFQNGTQDPVSD